MHLLGGAFFLNSADDCMCALASLAACAYSTNMNQSARLALYLAWLVAIVAMAGSLFFSEIQHFPPCVLCWYQRIFMYPLVLLIGVGLLRKDANLPAYILPLSLAGMVVAFGHVLLYYGVIPEAAVPCAAGVSCTTKFIEWFGFITIPLLSLTAFTVISGCAVVALRAATQGVRHE